MPVQRSSGKELIFQMESSNECCRKSFTLGKIAEFTLLETIERTPIADGVYMTASRSRTNFRSDWNQIRSKRKNSLEHKQRGVFKPWNEDSVAIIINLIMNSGIM